MSFPGCESSAAWYTGSMHVLVATDSYGGFRSAPAAVAQIAEELAAHGLQPTCHAMSDGGEGFLLALAAHRNVEWHGCPIVGPIGRPTFATAGRVEDTWVVESAAALGFHLCGEERMPGRATSAGLGMLMAHLARRDEGPFILGLGGSATADGGLGMLQALGMRAIDGQGKTIDPRGGATALTRVRRLAGPPPLQDRVVQVLCDVQTPLREAAATYGPQKGVHPEDIGPLTDAHIQWADILNEWRHDHDMDSMDPDRPGGGAAGGVGFAAAAVLGGHLLPGAKMFSRLTELDRAIHQADVVVTGEGRLDPSTFQGKVVQVVIQRSREDDTMVVALVGAAVDVPDPPDGPDHIILTPDAADPEEAFLPAIQALTEHLLCQRA